MKKLFTFFAVMMMAITASAGNTEDLIAAMGYKIFYTSKGGSYPSTIWVENGVLTEKYYIETRHLSDNEVTKNGDDFVIVYSNTSYTFQVTDGKVTSITKSIMDGDSYTLSLQSDMTDEEAEAKKAAYAYLASLIGDKVYTNLAYDISVNDNSVIQIGTKWYANPTTFRDISVSGNDYLLTSFYELKFVVEDGAIAHVYSMYEDQIIEEYYDNAGVPASESELVALMGDDVFASYENKIYVSDGQVMLESDTSDPINKMATLIKIGKNYVFRMSSGDLIFFVEGGKVAGAMVRDLGFVFEKQSTTPIAEITIGENTTGYFTLSEFLSAYNEIETSASVKLLDDMLIFGNYTLYNEGANNITLDLNGHSIIGSNEWALLVFFVDQLTITGEGTIESNSNNVLDCYGTIVINGGTYKGTQLLYYIEEGSDLTINDGKFKAPLLYAESELNAKPIVKGGLFSMDPSDCVAEGYAVVANNDGATKGEYPYKVVEKSLIPTAVESIDAAKTKKAVKTIENGRVVIIKNGEKFDITGRKL